jgi:ketosteroid isomerase-like protein
MQSAMAANRDTSIAGTESKRGWFTQYNKLWYFCRGSAAHEWSYALQNPAEIVAEGYLAMANGRDVRQGIAAVYVAYGGIRSNAINARLVAAFGGAAVPVMSQPEDALPHI